MNNLMLQHFDDDLRSADVSSWMSNRDLVSLILDVVQTIESPKLDPNPAVDFNGILRPRMMVTVLSYCYATGMYSSQEIESAIVKNETVRYLCARTYPTWQDLLRFRRQHKELIHEALSKVLQTAYDFRLWLAASPDPECRACEMPSGTQHEASATINVSEIAHHRIKSAVFLDSVMLGD